MLTAQRFTGKNNVIPGNRLVLDQKTGSTALAEAMNVDIGLTGDIGRRAGFSSESAVCHKNIWQANGFMLATIEGGDLVAIDADGNETIIYESLGVSRVHYCNLPDGRTTFSNGTIQGIASSTGATAWGVPLPASIGAVEDIAGGLFAGKYTLRLTHVRTSDGLEGGPIYSAAFDIASGGIVLSDLPVLAGHTLNVYLSSHNDDTGWLAGNTATSMFSFTGANDDLQIACKTDQCNPPPVGTAAGFWNGRALVFVGSVLYASKPHQWELFDLKRDFKQFTAEGTLLGPVDGGIFAGTLSELAFLGGSTWDELVYRNVVDGPAIPGSAVIVDGKHVRRGDGRATGNTLLCIAGGGIVAGYGDGGAVNLTKDVYTTAATEVAAAFREVGGIPQYIAIPQ